MSNWYALDDDNGIVYISSSDNGGKVFSSESQLIDELSEDAISQLGISASDKMFILK